MEPTQLKPSKTRQELREIAAEMLKQGISEEEVHQYLVNEGLDLNSTYAMMGSLTQGSAYFRAVDAKIENSEDYGTGPYKSSDGGVNRDMVIGGIFFVGGIIITVGTLSSGNGGGIIAWGAILFGGIQFMKGLMRN